jgi:SAM-dependent methyltransferase
MSLFAWVFRNLEHRGVKGTLEQALNIIEDLLFDVRYRTDTARGVNLEDLTTVGSNKDKAYHYHPTRGRLFKKLMRRLTFPEGSVFVDFGSGKGKTLLLASRFGFKRAVGVEFSPELCATAERNVAAWRNKVDTHTEIRVVCCDAVDYVINDDENVFFMFNPFYSSMTERVVDNMAASLARKPRNAWLIYGEPLYRDGVERRLKLHEQLNYSYGALDFIVWSVQVD